MKNYTYNITINQKAVIDNGWDLKLYHIAILETIADFINCNAFISISDEQGIWHWCKISKILDALPMIDIKERRCKDLINKLCELGLLEVNPNNQTLGRHYIRLGKEYLKYKFYSVETPPMQKIAYPMQKKTEPCNLLHTPHAENCIPTMQKIAYDNNNNNIINIKDNNTKDSSNLQKFDNLNDNLESGTNIPQTNKNVKNKEKTCEKKEVPTEWQEVVNVWLEYKRKRKQGYKDENSIFLFYNKLLRLSFENLETARQIVEDSMANNYSGIFEPKTGKKPLLNSDNGSITTLNL